MYIFTSTVIYKFMLILLSHIITQPFVCVKSWRTVSLTYLTICSVNVFVFIIWHDEHWLFLGVPQQIYLSRTIRIILNYGGSCFYHNIRFHQLHNIIKTIAIFSTKAFAITFQHIKLFLRLLCLLMVHRRNTFYGKLQANCNEPFTQFNLSIIRVPVWREVFSCILATIFITFAFIYFW